MYASTFGHQNRLSLWLKHSGVPVRQSESEVELVRRLQAGDEATFRELIDRYGPKIYRQVYGILRNSDLAEDILQEVFAKVYLSIKSFELRSSLYSWISRIAINECYGFLRKTRPIYESDCEDGKVSAIMLNIPDRQPGADLAVMQRDFINKLLARLSEEERALLVWKEVDGLTVAKLSEMTGLAENTIKVKLFRARKRLAKLASNSDKSAMF